MTASFSPLPLSLSNRHYIATLRLSSSKTPEAAAAGRPIFKLLQEEEEERERGRDNQSSFRIHALACQKLLQHFRLSLKLVWVTLTLSQLRCLVSRLEANQLFNAISKTPPT